MEIILLKDVDNLGFADDIVQVKNGYARNYLIPQGYAILATPSAKKQLAEKLRQRAHKEKDIIEKARQLAEKIKALEIKIPAKAGKLGKLYGSINNSHIAKALQEHGIDIDKKYIKVIGGNVKRLGKYTAVIRLHREVVVELPFEVVKLEEKPQAEAAEQQEEVAQAPSAPADEQISDQSETQAE
ncbi:MAG: 50S ribosomal protein L9 [Chlorobi bacterium]|nr:50S ribosomal protein L9 [Chlorobiota bacterium]